MTDFNIEETIQLLSKLIQNRCVNPPGNELKSINTIHRFLTERGVESTIYKTAPERGNLLARIQGTQNGSKLMFGPSHVDVVPVTKEEEWEVDPFSGIMKNEHIWGRGALDMLFMVVTQVQAFVKLHQENFQPKGDLILLIVSDEEAGGKYGTEWMYLNHPDIVQTDYAVSESGGLAISPGKFIFMFGEKGGSWKRIRFTGTPGHGSMPYNSDNAVKKAGEAAERLYKYGLSNFLGIPVTTEFLKPMARGLGLGLIQRFMLTNKFILPLTLRQMKNTNQAMAKAVHGLTRMTISPNIIHGGSKINIIPPSAYLEVDIRTLPGQDEEYVIKHLQKAIGNKLAKEAIIEEPSADEGGVASYGNASPISSPFVQAMKETINEILPGSTLVPFMMPAVTDCRFLRERGIDAYGFALFDPKTPLNDLSHLAHGINERVSVKTLELSQEAYYLLAKKVLI